MSKIELAIKFGSNEIVVYRKDLGIVARQSNYIALERNKICAYGEEAKRLSFSSTKYRLCQPIQGINIIDTNLAEKLINNVMDQIVHENGSISALVTVPCALPEKKLLELKVLLHRAGVNKVTFAQNAVGVMAGISIEPTSQMLVVDMGKYMIDVSLLSKCKFDKGRNYLIGGVEMDDALSIYIQDNYNVTICKEYAEVIKDEVSSLYDNDIYAINFEGIDENGNKKQLSIKSNEVRVAITSVYDKIFDLIEEFINELPVDMRREVSQKGIIFVGGASSISGLVEYATKRLTMPVYVHSNPKDAVILGAGKLLNLNKGDYPYIKL